MRYKVVNALTPENAAYIAGLIDGEGTITLGRRHAADQRQLIVSIANTERSLLEYVALTLGAGKITSKRTVSEKHAPSFCYTVSNRQALSCIAQVMPYLRTYKRERARLALTDYIRLTPRNGKYTDALLRQRLEFENRFLGLTASSS
jgi:LAGLIDADG-like domain